MWNTHRTTMIPLKSSFRVSSGWIVLEPAAMAPLSLTVTVTFVDVPYPQLLKSILDQKSEEIFEN